jgi:hypothetical protein
MDIVGLVEPVFYARQMKRKDLNNGREIISN